MWSDPMHKISPTHGQSPLFILFYSSLLYLFRLEKLKEISKSVTSDVADECQKHETASPTQ